MYLNLMITMGVQNPKRTADVIHGWSLRRRHRVRLQRRLRRRSRRRRRIQHQRILCGENSSLLFRTVMTWYHGHCKGWSIRMVKTSCWRRFGMFRHPAWEVGSYRSGPPIAVTVGTKSTWGFHHPDGIPCNAVWENEQVTLSDSYCIKISV